MTVLTSVGYDLTVYTFLDVYTGDGTGPIRLEELDGEDFGLQNPCGITVDATLPDI